ncbi:hypothetical protein F4805DRAFT_417140 [Annulohypoxylon moriforme]|nr:hypothetical protein F4805DRAFT_417140 [Annulohypoxylon moriforme]
MSCHENDKPDFYSVLNVTRDATEDEIKSAFRNLSFRYHPDKKDSSTEANNENFIQLREAYETLSDPIRRRTYDRTFSQQRQEKVQVPQQSTNWPKASREEKDLLNQDVKRKILRGRVKNLNGELERLWASFDGFDRPRVAKLPLYIFFLELRPIILRMKDEGMRWENKIATITDETSGPIDNYNVLVSEHSRFQANISIVHQAIECAKDIDYALKRVERPGEYEKPLRQLEFIERMNDFLKARQTIDDNIARLQ